MHYVPASFLQIDSDPAARGSENEEDLQRYSFWPLYLLAGFVGVLLLSDQLIAWINAPTWLAWQKPFGFRLALIAAVLGGARILYQTLDGLFEGKIGADLALTIATLAAIILGEPVVAALVVFIALVGESLEGIVAGRAHRALNQLFELCPNVVHRYRPDQDLEQDLPLSEVVIGDLLTVRPGERVPVDGVIVRGKTEIDQSALTGESWPVSRQEGEQVHAGTLNQLGGILIQVEKVGRETTFGQIVQLVSEAIQKKSPIEREADRLARLFLPVVLTIASVTLIVWRLRMGYWSAGWMPALSVLVVACPCPLILATPSAVLAAMSWLAKRGVIIKGSEVLERLALVDTLALDKTGTVTRGELQVTRVHPLGSLEENELLRIAAAAERRSEHLLGRLLVKEAECRSLVLPVPHATQVFPGQGILSQFSTNPFGNEPETDRGAIVLVGNAGWIEEQSISLSPEMSRELNRADEVGDTPLLVALEGECVGIIGVRDQLRPGAEALINELKQTGVGEATLLTGDRQGVTQLIAAELGLGNRYLAEQLPAQKARWIEERQRAGAKVLMVGDGINDAPALATATVGIALGGVGSQIAAEAGDVILMGDPLAPLPGLVRISRAVLQNIRQSILLFAFGMNGLGMLLSALGILNPVGASLFHEGASLAVMFNALRLLWFEAWEGTPVGQVVQSALQGFDRLISAFSPTRIVSFVARNGSTIVQLAISLALVVWSLSNLVLLREGEQALVTRFGKQSAILSAGLHLRWPYPLEKLYREQTDLVRTLQLGFRGEGDGDTQGKPTPAIEWQAEHRGTRFQAISDESLMLGGEEVPLELTSELHFQIEDLSDYLLSGNKPEELLRSSLERVLRELVSTRKLETLLTSGRSALEQAALKEVREQIEPLKLGIKVLDIALLDVHPPIPVIPDYRKVGDALEYQEELINDGQKTYVRDLMLAIGESGLLALTNGAARPGSKSLGIDQDWQLTEPVWEKLTKQTGEGDQAADALGGTAADLLQTARGRRTKLVEEAQGEADSFDNLATVDQQTPLLTRAQILWEFREQILSQIPLTLLDPKASGRRQWIIGAPSAIQSVEQISSEGVTPPLEDPLAPIDQLATPPRQREP